MKNNSPPPQCKSIQHKTLPFWGMVLSHVKIPDDSFICITVCIKVPAAKRTAPTTHSSACMLFSPPDNRFKSDCAVLQSNIIAASCTVLGSMLLIKIYVSPFQPSSISRKVMIAPCPTPNRIGVARINGFPHRHRAAINR